MHSNSGTLGLNPSSRPVDIASPRQGTGRPGPPSGAPTLQRMAVAGRVLLTEAAGRGVVLSGPSGESHALSSLTCREREVAYRLGRGFTNREIAGEMFLSVKTVEYHVANIFAKLGLDNRQQLRDHVHDDAREPELDALTGREREVACLVGRGFTNREIAGEMFLSVKTVEYHMANIFAKLALDNRQQLRDHVRHGTSPAFAPVPALCAA